MRPVPVNDLRRHIEPLRESIASAVDRVVSRGHFILGPETRAFEEEFAHACGTKHAVGVGNGTDAIELGLRAIGVASGDAVATVANAGGYSTTAIRAIGAIPVYVEIDPDTWTMAAEDFERAAARHSLRAVVVTHLYGQMAEMPRLSRIAQQRGIPILEDCAQAHGAALQGRPAGSWGALGTFSFYPTKNLGACGDGGAIVTDHDGLCETLRALRQYGWTSKYRAERRGGRNSRLDELQAAILREFLPRLPEWNARRREIAAFYTASLRDAGLVLPPSPSTSNVCHLYVVRTESRDRLMAGLAELGIGTEVHYPIPDHRQAVSTGEYSTELPHTEAVCSTVLTLPCFPELTDSEIQRVATSVCTVLNTIRAAPVTAAGF